MLHRITILIALLTLTLSAQAAGKMQLGTNFWNLGWHNPADCFTDVRNVTGENPWNPQFLKEIAIFKNFRFMDWDNTNNSQRQKWTQRTAKDTPKQNPVAYEWMIDLCNRMNADMWVTIPHLTITRETRDNPSDYALRLCLLVKTGIDMKDADLAPILPRLAQLTADGLIKAGGVKTCEPLKPNLKLYVEYSNETWNGMFKQSHYCTEEGLALNLDKNKWTAGFRYHAWAAIRLFRAADLVFGADSKRVVRVLATHSANAWLAGQHLQVMNDQKLNPWKIKPDAISTAPYFGHDVAGDDPDAVEKLRKAIGKSAADSAKHRKIADEAGLALIAYEGGQHVTKAAQEINRNPVMFDLYQQYLTEMARYFSVFVHYAHVGQAGKGGAWGAIERTGQPIEEAHKHRALAAFGSQNPTQSSDPAALRTGATLFAKENLVAWCIVPFDAKKRGPKERAEMLSRLGIKKVAYDWREEHVNQWDEELSQYNQHGIQLTAFWVPSRQKEIFDLLRRHNIKTQIWVDRSTFPGATQEEKINNAIANLTPIIKAAADEGHTVALYNHGNWFGQPENLVAITQRLRQQGHSHVGIVYNLHHAHDQIERLPEILGLMRPYLLCLNLNGMKKAGPKILPLAAGDNDVQILQAITQSGYTGPIGILNHREEMDAEVALRQNLEGLARLQGR